MSEHLYSLPVPERPAFGLPINKYGWHMRQTHRLSGSHPLMPEMAPEWAIASGISRFVVGIGSELRPRNPDTSDVQGTLRVYALTDQRPKTSVHAGLVATIQLSEPSRRVFAESGRALARDGKTLHDLLWRLRGPQETPLAYTEELFRRKYQYVGRG